MSREGRARSQEGGDAKAEEALREAAKKRQGPVMAIMMLLACAMSSIVAIWSAYNMLRQFGR